MCGLQAKVEDKLKDAYRAGFTVVTQKDVTESIKSYACTPQVQTKKLLQVNDDGKFVKPEDKTPGSYEEEKKADILNWDFIKLPLNANNNLNDSNMVEPEVVHHLKEDNIYENSLDEDDAERDRKADSNKPS